jgi:cell division initiation protein
MKLSSLDVQHQEFGTTVGGYQRKQVREFLKSVADAFDEALRENQQLRDEVASRDKRIEALQADELELKQAVVAAERIGNELKQNARKEAELILRQAENAKAQAERDAEARLKQVGAELHRLERESQLFKEQFRGLLRAYERSLEGAELRISAPKAKAPEKLA